MHLICLAVHIGWHGHYNIHHPPRESKIQLEIGVRAGGGTRDTFISISNAVVLEKMVAASPSVLAAGEVRIVVQPIRVDLVAKNLHLGHRNGALLPLRGRPLDFDISAISAVVKSHRQIAVVERNVVDHVVQHNSVVNIDLEGSVRYVLKQLLDGSRFPPDLHASNHSFLLPAENNIGTGKIHSNPLPRRCDVIVHQMGGVCRGCLVFVLVSVRDRFDLDGLRSTYD
mmetsp:Transcript_60799/g.100488  ORF Transcript_60799/g.100488 Transcript_60799/m.100488 type:complete len:227 (-) Transcript_60799:886-1566(-)